MLKEEIAACCKALKLGQNLVENYDKMKAVSHEEYLLELLKLDVARRKANRNERLLKSVGFYAIKAFADYSCDEIKLPSNLTPQELKDCKFVEEKKNLIFYGNVGTGKTHLATAIGVEASKKGLSVKFYRTAALVNRLREARKEGEISRILKALSKLDLLICDEWGYVPLDREGAQLLF